MGSTLITYSDLLGALVVGVLSELIDDPQLDRILEFARLHLGMSVAFVVEVLPDRQIYRSLNGDAASFGLKTGEGLDLLSAYCPQMLNGRIPNAIGDTSKDARVRAMRVTSIAQVGSYIGVPVMLSDGSVYGSFGCLSHEPQVLIERDVRFMEMLVDLVVPAVEEVREHHRSRLRISDLIDASELTMALQPIFDVHDGRCLGVEALARFPASYGNTEEVFEAARSVGLGTPLERLAVTQAVALMPSLKPQQFLAVNATPQAAYDLAAIAAERPALLERLVLEITEHAAVESYEELGRALRPAREQGLRVAIDDAGAGYASLKHVVKLEPDIIKIDRSLIEGVAGDRARRSAVGAFVLLALDIGASVIAEGVEKSDDLEAVKDLGVDAAQGYLLARPTTDRGALRDWFEPGHPLPQMRSRVASVVRPR